MRFTKGAATLSAQQSHRPFDRRYQHQPSSMQPQADASEGLVVPRSAIALLPFEESRGLEGPQAPLPQYAAAGAGSLHMRTAHRRRQKNATGQPAARDRERALAQLDDGSKRNER
jgi:hypothetical protein